jgi:hypothetical protein
MPLYTQILACTERPTQVLTGLKGLDVFVFPHTEAGNLLCEKTSETLDVRILRQVSKGISWSLGRGPAVLAVAGDEGAGFWCGLFEGGTLRFEHNRLTGPRQFTEKPASPAEVDVLCGYMGAGDRREAVYESLTGRPTLSAVDRHAAFAQALGLPAWTPGVGYSRIVAESVPPEAGTPKRPPRSLRELQLVVEETEDPPGADSLAKFNHACERAFRFLEEDFGFRRKLSGLALAQHPFPQIIDNVWVIGPGNRRPGYKNPYMLRYRSRQLTVVIEGLSFGARTRLCLLDPSGRHLDLTKLVERRDPELLDLCRLADTQSEQIPVFASALRTCASDVLAGDRSAISFLAERGPGFSFSDFWQPDDGDYILAMHGPRLRPRTIGAQIRRALLLRKIKA